MGKNDIKVAFVPMSEYWTSVGRVQPTTCRHTKLLSLEKSTHIHMSRRNRGLLYSVCLRWYNYNLTWYGNHILPLKGKGLKKLWNNSPPKLDDGAKTLHVHIQSDAIVRTYGAVNAKLSCTNGIVLDDWCMRGALAWKVWNGNLNLRPHTTLLSDTCTYSIVDN